MNLFYHKGLSLYILTLSVVLGMSDSSVTAGQEGSVSTSMQGLPGSYCGVYCIYSALKYYGIDVKPEELFKPQYIGSPQGSSLAELKEAAEDNGLFGEPAAKLTAEELRHSPYPVIIHVKSNPVGKQYDHYELFLKTRQGQAWLYDPPASAGLMPFGELAARWDGTGLVVSNRPIDVGLVFRPGRVRFVVRAGIAVAVVLVISLVRRKLVRFSKMSGRALFGLSMAQGAGLVLAAVLAGFVYHFFDEAGFLARADATACIRQAYRGSFIPRVSKVEVRRLLSDEEAVFVDARPSYVFKAERLAGVINIPLGTGGDERQEALAGVDKKARIIVYCQNSGCMFAEMVAVQLLSDGFSNVALYRGGREDWVAKKDGKRRGTL